MRREWKTEEEKGAGKGVKGKRNEVGKREGVEGGRKGGEEVQKENVGIEKEGPCKGNLLSLSAT